MKCTCGYDNLDVTPFSKEWHEGHKDHHMAHAPHLWDEPFLRTVRNLDENIQFATPCPVLAEATA